MYSKADLEYAIQTSNLIELVDIVNTTPDLLPQGNQEEIARIVSIAIKYHSLKTLEWLYARGVKFTDLYNADGNPALVATCKAFSVHKSYFAVFSFILEHCQTEINCPNKINGLTPLGALIRYGSYPQCKPALDELIRLKVDPESIRGLDLNSVTKPEVFNYYANNVIDALEFDYRSTTLSNTYKIKDIAHKLLKVSADPTALDLNSKVFLLHKFSPFFDLNRAQQASSVHITYLCARIINTIEVNNLNVHHPTELLAKLYIFYKKKDYNLNLAPIFNIVKEKPIAERLEFVLVILKDLAYCMSSDQIDNLMTLLPEQQLVSLDGEKLANLYATLFFLGRNVLGTTIENIIHDNVGHYADDFMRAIASIPLERYDQDYLMDSFVNKTDLICGEFAVQFREELDLEYQPSILFRQSPTPDPRDYDADDDTSEDEDKISALRRKAKFKV